MYDSLSSEIDQHFAKLTEQYFALIVKYNYESRKDSFYMVHSANDLFDDDHIPLSYLLFHNDTSAARQFIDSISNNPDYSAYSEIMSIYLDFMG